MGKNKSATSHLHIEVQFSAPFHCQQCGACCKTSGWVYVSSSEITLIADYLQLDIFSFKQGFVQRDRGWDLLSTPTFRTQCFLDEAGKCTIYPVRPQTCRTYPYQFSCRAEYKEAISICPELRRQVESNKVSIYQFSPKVSGADSDTSQGHDSE